MIDGQNYKDHNLADLRSWRIGVDERDLLRYLGRFFHSIVEPIAIVVPTTPAWFSIAVFIAFISNTPVFVTG